MKQNKYRRKESKKERNCLTNMLVSSSFINTFHDRLNKHKIFQTFSSQPPFVSSTPFEKFLDPRLCSPGNKELLLYYNIPYVFSKLRKYLESPYDEEY